MNFVYCPYILFFVASWNIISSEIFLAPEQSLKPVVKQPSHFMHILKYSLHHVNNV